MKTYKALLDKVSSNRSFCFLTRNIAQPLHDIFSTSLSVRNTRMLRDPFLVEFPIVFDTDIACLQDSSAVGLGTGLNSKAPMICVSLRSDAGFDAGWK